MAVSNLNVYDILVDLISGVFAVGLIVGIFGPGNISFTLGAGLLLIAYVVGRIFHALGSFQPIQNYRRHQEEMLFENYLADRKHGLSFRHRMMSKYNSSDNDTSFDYETNGLEGRIIEDIVGEFNERWNDELKLEEGGIKSHNESASSSTYEETDNILSARYYGENYLYGHNTLYRKYQMLTTFYRSLWLISFLGFILYLFLAAVGLVSLYFDSNLGFYNISYLLVSIPLLIIIGYVSLRQHIKFKFRATRAFINDLHRIFVDDIQEA